MRRSERVDAAFAVCRASHADGVYSVTLRGESEILRGVWLRVRVVKCPGNHLSWPFAKRFPWCRGVNGLAVDFQPCAYFSKRGLYLVWERSVCARSKIQHQIPILAHDVHELM